MQVKIYQIKDSEDDEGNRIQIIEKIGKTYTPIFLLKNGKYHRNWSEHIIYPNKSENESK